MRVFVFGIGGTGSRVLRSLTMLLASGVKLKEDVTIVPVIIDTDARNGDTARTCNLLRSYNAIRKHFVNKGVSSQSDSFFNTHIQGFKNVDNDIDAADIDIQFNFQNQDDTFADFINFRGITDEINREALKLFYSDSITEQKKELELNLSVGFKGNPSIGSVVFNDLKESQQFKDLTAKFNENDRIFIISSIFGGTGSSGFPTLVKLIRNSSNPQLQKAIIGAITVMPYFNIKPKDGSAINSAVFDTKTKSALSFYAKDEDLKKVNALYYIADSKMSGEGFENNEGAEEQLNPGHIVEFLSATSVIDFINKKKEDLKLNGDEGKCYEFGADGDNNDGEGRNPYGIKDFSDDTKKQYIIPLVRFAYAAKIATDFIPDLVKKNILYDQKENDFGVPAEYRKLKDFFEEFKKWSGKEMSSELHGRKFNSFDFNEANEHLNNIVHGKEIKTNTLGRTFGLGGKIGLPKAYVSDNLLIKKFESKKDIGRMPERYLTSLYETSKECFNKLEALP